MKLITLIILATVSSNVRAGRKLTINWALLPVGTNGKEVQVPPLVLEESEYSIAVLNGKICPIINVSHLLIKLDKYVFLCNYDVTKFLQNIMNTEMPGERKMVDSYQLDGEAVVKVSFLNWLLFAVNKEHAMKIRGPGVKEIGSYKYLNSHERSILFLKSGKEFQVNYPQFYSVGFMDQDNKFV